MDIKQVNQLPCGLSPPPCLLRSLFWRGKGSKKTNPQSNNNYQKRMSKIDRKSWKVDARGGPGGSWGRSLDYFGVRGAPEGSQGRPEPKKWRKVRPFFVASLFFGHPKIIHFRYFSIFVLFFGGCFSEAVSGGLRAPFLKDLEVVSEVCFHVFLNMLGRARY